MRIDLRGALVGLASAAMLLVPAVTSAHEVYVLSPDQVAYALHLQPFDMLAVVRDNLGQFVFWAFIAALVVGIVFFVSLFRRAEQFLAPFFARMKRYAPATCRITVGLGMLAGAYYQATYGPELSLAAAYGPLTPLITALLIIVGALFLIGVWVRAAASIALVLFGYAVWLHGAYMLTYANYFGEFLALFLLGTHVPGTRVIGKDFFAALERMFAKYEFLIVRVSFGISLLYASLYAKVLHNNLALMVAQLPLAGHPYGLAHYLGFEPHFLVLGAALIELAIGTFFLLGIEIRFTSIFLLFWLSLSLWWFGEAVWPHIILIGIPIAFIMHGYDQYSVEGYFFDKGKREPVL
jgi:uncharacterized membrane protein YphA (DoxX/SURF4 family)